MQKAATKRHKARFTKGTPLHFSASETRTHTFTKFNQSNNLVIHGIQTRIQHMIALSKKLSNTLMQNSNRQSFHPYQRNKNYSHHGTFDVGKLKNHQFTNKILRSFCKILKLTNNLNAKVSGTEETPSPQPNPTKRPYTILPLRSEL